MKRTVVAILAVVYCLLMASPCGAEEVLVEEPGAAAGEKEKQSVRHRLLYYIPNRLLDIVDILRLRARVGPGLAGSLRATEYISFFGGTYNTVYAGLPGARAPEKWRSPVGKEKYKGIIFFGVDATDDTRYGPRYSPAEFVIGAQLLIVGGDIGFEPVELGDMLAGLFLFDPVGDDL